jgi:low temperature requirement protein LtrA
VSAHGQPAARPWHIPMTGRDPEEAHRASTPLELLFDLCFVVAVAGAAGALHHDLAEGKVGHGLFSYVVVFFAIWWPWVNFTWFASAYDTDDVIYRLLTFVQIAGVLVVSAGVPNAFNDMDFRMLLIGYVVMRIALVAQWLRAAYEDPADRSVAIRFAIGVGLVQLAWVLRPLLPNPFDVIGFGVLAVFDLAVPIWAERSGRGTPWHPEHIGERYGLFTIIVLGECILAVSGAAQLALTAGGVSISLLTVAVGGLLLVLALWWSYFKHPAEIDRDLSIGQAVTWGYGHYVVFAAIAALGAGLQVAVDATHQTLVLSPWAVALTVAIPVIVYLVATVLLHRRSGALRLLAPLPVVGVVLLAIAAGAGWFGVPVAILAMALTLVAFVAYSVVVMQRGATERGAVA